MRKKCSGKSLLPWYCFWASCGHSVPPPKKIAYPNGEFITDAQWLRAHLKDEDIVIADVRTEEYFDNSLIPGAVRMVWSDFRFNDIGKNLSSTFVGVKKAQDILCRRGITRNDTVVLYDSVERDGGATVSYGKTQGSQGSSLHS